MAQSMDIEAARKYVENFDCHEWWAYPTFSSTWTPPIVAALVYVLLVFGVPTVIPEKGLGSFRLPFFCWNGALAIFSFFGFIACLSFTLKAAANPAYGIKGLVCSDEMIWGVPEVGGSAPASGAACYGAVGLAAVCFTWSKFVELGDTAFLLVRARPVEFLHWYHHFTVLLYCWFAFATGTPSALIFGTMNYGVHSFMYTYYAVSQYSQIMRPLRILVTTCQLLQMAGGVTIGILTAWYTHQGGCSRTYDTRYFVFCWSMYGSYFLLFAHLFYASYIAKTRKPPQKPKKE
eukprot:TRINITY_DN14889_c0_g1_i1.p1 TRINITY_DN14889_c0_g1~~TRINITY_DN14889_c0_g1_i1.p1  ORF type:complete len:322 (+),score=114.01 TRINITY_DN14889_c0_g1_i1:98-967(+)